jgi:serine/threonine-protein kinase HipA
LKEFNVFLRQFGLGKRIVGKLAESRKRIYFEYDPSFLSNPIWLSPYKLPPEPGLHEHHDREFGPVFGLFDDSLPDGWGLLLMDHFFRKKGINLEELSILDRLSFLGNSTMGALTYEPGIEHEKYDISIDLPHLAKHAEQILEGEIRDVLPQLMGAGGSPGGARPKVLIGIKNNTMISGEDILPETYEHWMVKFSVKNDFADCGPVEYAYSLMAAKAGISMPETRLFGIDNKKKFFGVKRFDRRQNQRFHVHTFGNLIHSNFRIPGCDYETFLKVCLDLTKNHQDVQQGFCRMIFNVIANNRDDHVKNFGFMIDENLEWSLAPAYDLTYSPGPGGEHSMSLSGEARTPGIKEIMKLGKISGLSTSFVKDSIDRVLTAVKKWPDYAQTAGVSEETMTFVHQKIKKNLMRFNDI